jgi:hypothetical protein
MLQSQEQLQIVIGEALLVKCLASQKNCSTAFNIVREDRRNSSTKSILAGKELTPKSKPTL